MASFPVTIVSPTNPQSTDKLSSPSHSQQHQSHNDEIIQVETKIGTGSSTPTSGKVLRATGTGTSSWSQVSISTDVASATSANLASIISDETGSGSLVFGTSPSITTPSITTSINDANGNEVIKTPATTSAVNEATMTNAATGNNPVLSVTGNDSNIGFYIRSKGTGSVGFSGTHDGWVDANESWSFASSTTITVPSDATTKYAIGDTIKLTQSSTVKYFIITTVATTLLTVSGLSAATVANSTITANFYSKEKSPQGLQVGPLYNPNKFRVYRSAALTLSSGAATASPMDTKVFDTGTNVDIVTNKGRFTAPNAGFYIFGGRVSATTNRVFCSIYKNGAEDSRGVDSAVTATDIGSTVVSFLSLAANDIVELYYFSSGAVAADVGPSQMYFWGTLISSI